VLRRSRQGARGSAHHPSPPLLRPLVERSTGGGFEPLHDLRSRSNACEQNKKTAYQRPPATPQGRASAGDERVRKKRRGTAPAASCRPASNLLTNTSPSRPGASARAAAASRFRCAEPSIIMPRMLSDLQKDTELLRLLHRLLDFQGTKMRRGEARAVSGPLIAPFSRARE